MTKVKPIKEYKVIDYVSLIIIVALAVILRSLGQVSSVLLDSQILFREVDPYYQVRLAENMVHNGLSMLRFDHFAQYPDGAIQGYGSIIPWITSIIANAMQNNPSDYQIDLISAWLPVIIAGLVCIVVYFLGKEVFKSRFVGIFGALLVAIIPSEFLHRSLLGFTDHHVLEVLFSCCAILCLIKTIRLKSWIWGIGFLLSFWLYCINWIGWPMFTAILIVWGYFYFGIKKLSRSKHWLYFGIPVVIIAIGIISIPQVRVYAMAFLSNTFLGFTGTIQEVKPINPKDYYLLYNISGILAFGGIYLSVKHKINSLFLVWTIFFIAASIAEKRWGYYSTIGISLYAAYVLFWVGTKVKKDWRPYILIYCCAAIIFVTYPYALGISKRANDIPPEWNQACLWLREETPEPFDDPDAYYSQEDIGNPKYGVFSWWDYGHYIIQIGHRVPISSPTQQESDYYSFFTEDTEDKANAIISGLNIKYVMIDDTLVGPKYYAIWSKTNGSMDGWQESLEKSMIYKMYYGKSETWVLIKQFGKLKIFGREEWD